VVKKYRLLWKATLILSVFLLAACHSTSASQTPPKLLLLDTKYPYDPLIIELKRRLQSAQIYLNTLSPHATCTLHIPAIEWEETIYPILYSGNATSYTYTLRAIVSLQASDKKIGIAPKIFQVSRSLLKNANQIYTPAVSPLMKREIAHTLATLIYYYVVSEQYKLACGNSI
jgi:LPS-assembly lipoprotein